MDSVQLSLIVLALLTFRGWQFAITGYWKLPTLLHPADDILGAAHDRHLDTIKRRFGSTWSVPVALTVLAFGLTPWWSWSVVDPHMELRPIILASSGVVTWRAVSMDVDLATGRGHLAHRLIVFAAWIGVWFHPGFLVLLLHTAISWLRSQYHHQHLPIRLMLMFLAYLGALPICSFLGHVLSVPELQGATAPMLFLFLCLSASHYVNPGLNKLSLGPRWFSWMRDNRLHALAMAAYLWGWVRFLPESTVVRVVRFLRPLDRPFQVATIAIEVGAITILFEERLCIGLLLSFVAFQLMVTILSGIFFWQNMVVNAVLAWAVWSLPAHVAGPLFGFESGIAAAAILLLLPYRGKVWNPTRLGWWDTPLSCRVHWEAKGKSGKWYGMYNDFMCPNDRVFGQTYGDFLSEEKRITDHLGETKDRSVFDALNGVGSDLAKLAQVKAELGESRYDPALVAKHARYATPFLQNFNAGKRKRVCPSWLKAPGGQLFHWGKLPRFTGQEPIDELVARYREEYFDGHRIVQVTDRVIWEVRCSGST